MDKKTVRSLIAQAVLILVSLVSTPTAEASVFTIDFTGTYTTGVDTVFGQAGNSPFHYSITYDTALDTNTVFIPAGSDVSGTRLVDDLYGYSASGVIASSLTFGTHTFAPSALSQRTINGNTADFYLNTDLTVAAPTKVWLYLQDIAGDLSLGVLAGNATTTSFAASSHISENFGGFGNGTLTLTSTPVSSVPEPTTLLLLSTGLLGFCARARRTTGR